MNMGIKVWILYNTSKVKALTASPAQVRQGMTKTRLTKEMQLSFIPMANYFINLYKKYNNTRLTTY